MMNRDWIHKRTRNKYYLLYIANSHATDPRFVETAVYEDMQGRVWSRPMVEFLDKFETAKEGEA